MAHLIIAINDLSINERRLKKCIDMICILINYENQLLTYVEEYELSINQ